MRDRPGARIAWLRGKLNRDLFVPAPENGLGFWEGSLLIVCFLLLAGILQLFRTGPSATLHSLWAEDGWDFLHGALSHGFFADVTSTYAEYLVVVPRLAGEIAGAVPLRDAPYAINTVGVLVVALSGIVVWVAAAGQIRNPYLRGLLVALTVLTPVGAFESVASATYSPWYMDFAVFWLLVWRPKATWSAALGGIFILATGLSSPVVFFFIPLAALRALAIRDRRDSLLVGSFALAVAIQLPVTLLSSEERAAPEWTHNVWTTFLQRVVDGSVLGVEAGGSLWEHWGWPFLIALSAGVAIYFVWLAVRASSGRLLATIAIATSVLAFFVSMYQRGAADVMVWGAGFYNGLGGRYAIVPSLLLISAALVLIEGQPKTRGRPWPAIATSCLLLVALVTSFDLGGSGREMSPWQPDLNEAAVKCRATSRLEMPVEVLPRETTMLVPCQRLESEFPAPPAGDR